MSILNTLLDKAKDAEPKQFGEVVAKETDAIFKIIDNRWDQIQSNALKDDDISQRLAKLIPDPSQRQYHLKDHQRYSSMHERAVYVRGMLADSITLSNARKERDKKELEEVFAPIAPSRLNSNTTQDLQRNNSNISISSVKTATSYGKIAPPEVKGEIKKSQQRS